MTFDEIINLKIGDLFYEIIDYKSIAFIVISEPIVSDVVIFNETRRKVVWDAVCQDVPNYTQNYLVTEGLQHYGPKLHR
jgi:hypothetical protein